MTETPSSSHALPLISHVTLKRETFIYSRRSLSLPPSSRPVPHPLLFHSSFPSVLTLSRPFFPHLSENVLRRSETTVWVSEYIISITKNSRVVTPYISHELHENQHIFWICWFTRGQLGKFLVYSPSLLFIFTLLINSVVIQRGNPFCVCACFCIL